MDRFGKERAVRSVSGYYFPRPHEVCLGKNEDAFNRAKQEVISNMKNHITEIENLSYEDFLNLAKKGID
ncbi:MAG: hypothetical protein ACMZI0_15030 [Symbiopectobacterium sp.]|uniref:hypothetical protein n=1 Tax=Symbiopectobacterium sp. TaxID=2952789 RepID=UPI0039E800E9